MDIKTFPLGPLETNCYVASNASAAIAVDVGGNPAPVAAYLKENGLRLEAVLLTHLHCDHLYGVDALSRAFGVTAFAGAADAPLLDTEIGGGGLMGLPAVPRFAWEPLGPGDLTLLGQTCRVLATPGHSPGSLSFYFPDAGVVFVGDLIFYRSVGRTDFEGGDAEALLRSVRESIFTLPPATVLYSGHGPASTVGDEMAHNPFFTEFAR